MDRTANLCDRSEAAFIVARAHVTLVQKVSTIAKTRDAMKSSLPSIRLYTAKRFVSHMCRTHLQRANDAYHYPSRIALGSFHWGSDHSLALAQTKHMECRYRS